MMWIISASDSQILEVKADTVYLKHIKSYKIYSIYSIEVSSFPGTHHEDNFLSNSIFDK